MRSGMKGTSSALSHQENMEAAYILMRQIEYDLSKATYFEYPKNNVSDKNAKWFGMLREPGKEPRKTTYMYSSMVEGVDRKLEDSKLDGTDPNSKSVLLAKEHPVKLQFTHYASETADFNKHALWVEIEVGSIKGNVASFTLSRLIELKKSN